MKAELREKARELRLQGMSVKSIAKQINAAISSVSMWVRNIPLSEEQKKILKKSSGGSQSVRLECANKKRATHRKIREKYQEEGQQKAICGEALHAFGCALYWGEGRKERNCVELANSDPYLLILFKQFLDYYFQLEDNDYHIAINCYLNNGLSMFEIEQFWLKMLNLPTSCLRKSTINPIKEKHNGRKLIYGVCKLIVCKTHIIQHIYGAIQEYGKFKNEKWLD